MARRHDGWPNTLLPIVQSWLTGDLGDFENCCLGYFGRYWGQWLRHHSPFGFAKSRVIPVRDWQVNARGYLWYFYHYKISSTLAWRTAARPKTRLNRHLLEICHREWAILPASSYNGFAALALETQINLNWASPLIYTAGYALNRYGQK